jgi:hypothetical protein
MEGKMKAIKLFIVVVLVFWAFGLNGWCQGSDSKDDNFGKIIGRIFDEETNIPVSEIFKVLIVDCSDISNPKSTNIKLIKSSSRGIFVFNRVRPGIYCVEIFPLAGKTIYCYEPTPNLSSEFQHIVKIIPGQITRMNCKARRGGNLKVILVDKNGNAISPRSIMPPSPYSDFPNEELRRLHIQIDSLDYPKEKVNNFVEYNTISDDYLDDGEITLSGLFPGRYKFDVDLRYLGYGWPLSFTNIEITKDQTTELKVLIDFTENSGLEGIVTDQNSVPIKGALVMVSMLNTENDFFGSIRTNQNGYYRIVGLKEGLYRLQVSWPWNTEIVKINHVPSQNIRVEKNTIKNKNIVLKKTID